MSYKHSFYDQMLNLEKELQEQEQTGKLLCDGDKMVLFEKYPMLNKPPEDLNQFGLDCVSESDDFKDGLVSAFEKLDELDQKIILKLMEITAHMKPNHPFIHERISKFKAALKEA
jgi:hypothetical protein